MKASFPLAIFAAAVVLYAPLTVYAQTETDAPDTSTETSTDTSTNTGTIFDTTEQWLEAANAIEDATVVAGIEPAEGALRPAGENQDLFIPDSEADGTLIPPRTQLTFPWGTLTDSELPLENLVVNLRTSENIFNFKDLGNASLVPDENLGVPIGVSLTRTLSTNEIGLQSDLTYDIFDGDTLLASLSFDSNPITVFSRKGQPVPFTFEFVEQEGFIAPAGATISRVEIRSGNDGETGLFSNVQFLFANDTPTIQESLIDIAAEVSGLIEADQNSVQTGKLTLTNFLLERATSDAFFEEDGNRLSEEGTNFFRLARLSVFYLQIIQVDGADELAGQITTQLGLLVDNEIAFATENDGISFFIDRAESFSAVGESLSQPSISSYASQVAWTFARLSTSF